MFPDWGAACVQLNPRVGPDHGHKRADDRAPLRDADGALEGIAERLDALDAADEQRADERR
jgi:hypothetical protein